MLTQLTCSIKDGKLGFIHLGNIRLCSKDCICSIGGIADCIRDCQSCCRVSEVIETLAETKAVKKTKKFIEEFKKNETAADLLRSETPDTTYTPWELNRAICISAFLTAAVFILLMVLLYCFKDRIFSFGYKFLGYWKSNSNSSRDYEANELTPDLDQTPEANEFTNDIDQTPEANELTPDLGTTDNEANELTTHIEANDHQETPEATVIPVLTTQSIQTPTRTLTTPGESVEADVDDSEKSLLLAQQETGTALSIQHRHLHRSLSENSTTRSG